MPSDISSLRSALGDDFLSNRPSFERFKARAGKRGLKVDRVDYDALMQDIRQLRVLLRAADVDPETVTVNKFEVNSWGKKGDDYFQVKASLTPKKAVPDLRPRARPVKFKVTTHRTGREFDTMMIPDIHVGFKRAGDGLVPLHDEQYVESLIGVIRRMRPARVILHGDFLDLAGFSTFKNDPGYTSTTKEAVQVAYDYLRRMRGAVGEDAEFVYIEGNHEHRIANRLQEVLPEALGLEVDGVPVTSPRHFLRLDELGIEYVAPYKTHIWRDGVRYLHGELIGSGGGDTTSKMLKKYGGKSCQGHTHRLGLNYQTTWGANGPEGGWAMEVGTGARLDGDIPGATYPDWQQGFGAIWASGQPAIFAYSVNMGGFDLGGVVIMAH